MHIKRPFVPGFLNKLDNYLLIHNPLLWSTRVHLILYYSLLFIGALTAIAYVVPDDPRNRSILTDWTGFIIVISIVTIVLWLIYLLRFNVFKRFGRITAAGTLINFICYFVTIAIIVFFAFIPSFVQSHRANRAYSNDEILEDVNNINTTIAQLDYHMRSHTWTVDTFQIVAPAADNDYTDRETDEVIVAIDTVAISTSRKPEEVSRYRTMSSTYLKERLLVDSTIKIGDSLYLFFTPPNYNFLGVYQLNNSYIKRSSHISGRLSDKEIYEKYIRHFSEPDRQVLRKRIQALIDKYTKGINHHHEYSDYDRKPGYETNVERRYHIADIENSMQNILERKIDPDSGVFSGLMYMLYYTSLILTLLVIIFRCSTARTFFLSLLTAFIIVILTAVITTFLHREKFTFYIFTLSYFVLFLTVASSVWRNRTRSVITGICINLFVFMVSFIPIIVTMFGIEIYRRRHINDLQAEEYISLREDGYMMYAQIGGLVLLVVLIATYIHALYRRWYSLPVE